MKKTNISRLQLHLTNKQKKKKKSVKNYKMKNGYFSQHIFPLDALNLYI